MARNKSKRFRYWASASLAVLGLATLAPSAQAADPIKIGFGMSLTGPLAANGKMSLVATSPQRICLTLNRAAPKACGLTPKKRARNALRRKP